MKVLLVSIAFGVCALFGVSAHAQAPAGAIAQCKDGTYFTGTSHKGACRGHQGVKSWLDQPAAAATPATADTEKKTKKSKKAKAAETAAAPAAAPAPAPAPKTAPASAPAPKPAAAPPPAPAASAPTSKHTPPTPASQLQQKAGGGPGLVWVNASSKVYHCPGDEWYGKTKEGSYMTEAAAKAAGNHAARDKECGK